VTHEELIEYGKRMGRPANPRAACMHGMGGGPECERRATEQRIVGGDEVTGVVVTLCRHHAEELDASE
jgi:hypothetical protein